jgi:hypothetical protein
MMVQAAFDIPQIVSTDFVVIEPPDVDDAPMILFDAAPRAVGASAPFVRASSLAPDLIPELP